MTATFNQIQDVLLAWLSAITGREGVLLDNGQLPKPRDAYITLLLATVENSGLLNSTLDATGLVETISGLTLLRADINLYGSMGVQNAMVDAVKLSRSLYASARYFDLWQLIGLGGVVSMQDLSFLETGAIKSRALLQIDFYANIVDVFDSTFIAKQPIVLKELTTGYEEEIKGGTNPKEKAAICSTG